MYPSKDKREAWKNETGRGVYTSVAGQVKVTPETKGNRADSDGSVTKSQTDL